MVTAVKYVEMIYLIQTMHEVHTLRVSKNLMGVDNATC